MALEGFDAASVIEHRVMTHSNLEAVNAAGSQNEVSPTKGSGAKMEGDRLRASLPPYSYQMIRLKV